VKFSVVTPVTYDKDSLDELRMPRYEMFFRCQGSIKNQSFTDFEWVVADDVSIPPVEEVFEADKVVRLKEKSGRLIARNAGMKEAQGEWITWLDADDEYASFYLDALNDAIRLYPDYKIFNFNHLIVAHNYSTHVRKFIDMSVQKDKPFPAGTVGAGSFIFHRSVMEDIGYFPELGLWDFAAKAFEEFPEIKPFYETKDADGKLTGQFNSLGNPWGEDWYYFYKMTRKYESKYLDFAPYIVHSRWGHLWADDPKYMADPGKKAEWNKNNL